MKDEVNQEPQLKQWEIIVSFILLLGMVSISLLFTIITLIISFYNKFYKQFLAQLMIMVIISEAVYGITCFFGLYRSEPFEFKNKNKTATFIQLSGSLFCDLITLLATLCISLKIYDSIVRTKKIFDLDRNMRIAIVIIIIFSLIITLVFVILEIFYLNDQTDDNVRCDFVACTFHTKLNKYILGILMILTIAIIIITCIPLCFLCKKKKRMMESISLEKNELIKERVNTIQCKLLVFPIVSAILWLWRLLYHVITFIVSGNKIDIPEWMLWVYSTINGFRGTIYTLMYIISHENLREIYMNKFCSCIKKNEQNDFDVIGDSELMANSNSFDSEDN